MANTKPKQPVVATTIRLAPETFEAVKDMAWQKRMHVSDYLRLAIVNQLKKDSK